MQELNRIVRTIEQAVTQSGESLVALSETSPVLLVFLRHAGCTFCREALSDIARFRPQIESRGVKIVLVYMGDEQAMGKLLAKYALTGVDRISDPERTLYQAFGLGRGRGGQLFGPKVIWRGFLAGLLSGHGLGRISGDPRQMPGVFLLDNSCIVRRFRHRSAADRPDYWALCESGFKPAETP